MPTYNTSKFVAEAIESILSQTFKTFELIIVDDGSTDNTRNIIKYYAKQDSRIRVIEVAHSGMANATDIGVEAAKYLWLAFADSDDVAVPNRLEKQLKAAQRNPKLIGLGSYFYFTKSNGQPLSIKAWGPKTEEEFYSLRQQRYFHLVYQATLFLKKEVFIKEGGYRPIFQTAADVEFIARLCNHGTILVIPEPLVLYRLHAKNTSIQDCFNQWIVGKYLKACHQKQLAGHPELSYPEFLAKYSRKNWLNRLHCFMTSSSFYYQKAGVYFFEKQYLPVIFYMGLSMLSNPFYAPPRIWQQLLSPKARKWLQLTKGYRS